MSKRLLTPMIDNAPLVGMIGLGRQSTAMLVLSVVWGGGFDLAVFANVGSLAENPRTLEYKSVVSEWYSCETGKELIEVHPTDRHGNVKDLYTDAITSKSSILPMITEKGGYLPRTCTPNYKIRPADKFVGRWLKAQGKNAAYVCLGISIDEVERAKFVDWAREEYCNRLTYWKKRHYPLLEHSLTARDCEQIVVWAGLPKASKSACWFCPFGGDKSRIEDIKRMEETINANRYGAKVRLTRNDKCDDVCGL